MYEAMTSCTIQPNIMIPATSPAHIQLHLVVGYKYTVTVLLLRVRQVYHSAGGLTVIIIIICKIPHCKQPPNRVNYVTESDLVWFHD